MPVSVLSTKLFAPPRVEQAVIRSRLIERLNKGLNRKLTLVCAPAGFGKSVLLADWAGGCRRPCVWVSLGAGEQDEQQFLAYLVGAVQAVDDSMGAQAWAMLQNRPPPPATAVLTALLNDVAEDLGAVLLVLDDYHLAACEAVDRAVGFLIEHLPPQMHLAVATREEPHWALGRLRGQGQLTEVRQDALRFDAEEAAAFLTQTMGLDVSVDDCTVLGTRTEGWIAGLQMAAIALQGNPDRQLFIRSFNGSHRFLQDFLLEEVLHQQTPAIQTFLLRTSVLDRMCAELCDAVTLGQDGHSALAQLERANLFLVPLDAERRWFRYHHLFAELLRQRLEQQEPATTLLVRASQWYEAQGQPVDAFQQAATAQDLDRAIRLAEGNGVPLYCRGATGPVIQWLQGQSSTTLDSRPRLWLMLAWAQMMAGYPDQMRVPLQGAVTALRRKVDDVQTEDLWGQVAALQAWSAIAKQDLLAVQSEAQNALRLLAPDNLAARTAVRCAQGIGHQYAGDQRAAQAAYEQVLCAGQSSGNFMLAVVAALGLASLQLMDNQLHLAAKTYHDLLPQLSDPVQLVACEAHLGLARILYEWNDLDGAELHARRSSQLAEPMASGVGLSAEVMLARIWHLRQRFADASSLLARSALAAQTRGFKSRLAEIVGAQTHNLLLRGELPAALALAQQHRLPLATAQVLIAQGQGDQALSLLSGFRAQMATAGRVDELLKALVTQALAWEATGNSPAALEVLTEALVLGEPAGLVRTFVDEGPAMARLLTQISARGVLPDYTLTLLAVLGAPPSAPAKAALLHSLGVEALSERELDILRLIQRGKSNQEIGEAVFLSLHTVKWHNQNIFDKLQVKRRTEAVARALELKLLSA